MFDVAAVRAALEQRLKSLEMELHQVGGGGTRAVVGLGFVLGNPRRW